MDRGRLGVVAALGTAQTLAWGSSYYLPAILADPIARDLGISSNWFFAAFSASLVISGLLGPRVCLSKIKSECIRGAIRRGLGDKEYALPSSRCAIGARPYPRPSACVSHYSSERKI
jgi:hypothetical protein